MFNSARFKLTIWYLAIIMAISFAFSTIIYKVSTNELERFSRLQRARIERGIFTIPIPIPEPSLIQETQDRIILNLIVINISIAVLSGAASYVLAGVTLKPIKTMVDDQSRFISDASHEIGTPLTSLKTAMEVHLRNKTSNLKEAKVLISESIDEVNKLQSLSQSLLKLAQYQKPLTNHTKLDRTSLKTIVTTAVHKVTPMANKKHITILSKVDNFKLQADKYTLTDLLVILLDNAIKYSFKNGTITVTAKRNDGQAAITIKDEGIGISAKDLPHIFDRFYRSDTARSKASSDGYGLGLSIAKKIVESQKGTISVTSTPNKGSTFTINLPISLLIRS